MKILRLLLITLILMNSAMLLGEESGYVMRINDVTALAGETIDVTIEITNEDDFVAFGLDIPLPDGFTFAGGPGDAGLVAERSAGHTFSATNVMVGGTAHLRIFAFHPQNNAFLGNEGEVFFFRLNTPEVPGSYDLNIVDGIISDVEENNLLTADNAHAGTVHLIGNELILHPATVIMNQDVTIDVEILNYQDFTAFQFGVILPDGFTFTGEASLMGRENGHLLEVFEDGNVLNFLAFSPVNELFSGSEGLVLQFELTASPAVGGDYDLVLVDPIISNTSFVNILTRAQDGVVTVLDNNTFYIVDIDDSITNETLTIELGIDNSFPFTAFQVDVVFPDGFTNIGTAVFAGRETNHILDVTPFTTIDGLDALRLIAYSPNNDLFVDFDGIVVEMSAKAPNLGGIYEIELRNALLAAPNEDEIPANTVNGFVTVRVENMLVIADALGCPGQVIAIELVLQNSQDATAYEAEIHFPEGFTFVSAEVADERSVNHVIEPNIIGEGVLKLVSYSPNNSLFIGTPGNGAVAHLYFQLPVVLEDEYEIEIQNAIISNVAFEDIITGTLNGIVSSNPEPFVFFAINGTVVGPNVDFEYCYSTEIEVTLHEVAVGAEPFTVIYTINDGEEITVTDLYEGDPVFTGFMEAGNYHIQVVDIIDGDGCSVTEDVLDAVYNVDVEILEEPFVYFAIGGDIVGPEADFAFCYNETIEVTLAEIGAGVAPFTVVYQINDEEPVTVSDLDVNSVLFAETRPAGTYMVQVISIEDGNGCFVSQDVIDAVYHVEVIVNPMPAVLFAFNEEVVVTDDALEYCYNTEVTVTLDEILVGTGPISLIYELNGVASELITIEEGGIVFGPETLPVGEHTLVVTYLADGNGCPVENPADIYNLSILVNPMPAVLFAFNEEIVVTGEELEYCYNTEVGVTLSEILVGVGPISLIYELNGVASELITVAEGEVIFEPSVLPVGLHSLVITYLADANGCTVDNPEDIYNLSILVNPMPAVLFAFNEEIVVTGDELEYCFDTEVTVVLHEILAGEGPISLIYELNGEASDLITVEEGGVLFGPSVLPVGLHSLVVTHIEDANGCEVTAPEDIYHLSILINPMPAVLFAFNETVVVTGDELEYCFDTEVTVTLDEILVGEGPISLIYELNGEASELITVEEGGVIFGPSVLPVGLHTLVVTHIEDANGCEVVAPESIYHLTILVNPMPAVLFAFNETVVVTGDELEYCYNTEVTVTLDQILVGEGPVSLIYELNGEASELITVEEGGVLFGPSVLPVGLHSLVVTHIEDANGCEVTAPEDIYHLSILVNPMPAVLFAFNEVVVVTGDELEYCFDTEVSVVLNEILVGEGPISLIYELNGEASEMITVEEGGVIFEPSVLPVGLHTLVVTHIEDANGCVVTAPEDIYHLTITIHPMPAVLFAFNGEVAVSGSEFHYHPAEEVSVTLADVLVGDAPFMVEWVVKDEAGVVVEDYSGSASDLFVGDVLMSSTLALGLYTVEVVSIVDANGCAVVSPQDTYYATILVRNIYELSLVANPEEAGSFNLPGVTMQFEGDMVHVQVTANEGFDFFNWFVVGVELSNEELMSPDLVFEMPGNDVVLTANFMISTLMGQVKYFNEYETTMPSLSGFQVSLDLGMTWQDVRRINGTNSAFMFDSLGAGTYELWIRDMGYTDNLWSQTNINATDALIIQRMGALIDLSARPWIGTPDEDGHYTPFAMDVADADNNAVVNGLDALMVLRRLVGQLASYNRPDFQVWGSMTDGYPQAPAIKFAHAGQRVHKATVEVSLGDNHIDVFYIATADMRARFIPQQQGKSSGLQIEYDFDQPTATEVGSVIEIPLYLEKELELGAYTLGLAYDNTQLRIESIQSGSALYGYTHDEITIAWSGLNPLLIQKGQPLAVITATVMGELDGATALFSLTAVSELADRNANTIEGVSLMAGTFTTDVETFIGGPDSQNLSVTTFPNPFSTQTTIRYTLPEAGQVQVMVYNQTGQLVEILVNENQQAGSHEVTMLRGEKRAGLYYYRISVDTGIRSYNATQSVMIVQ